MKKKILIGSMLVLTLLLLMPSIPAIQQKNVEDILDTKESELITKLRDLEIKKIKDLINKKPLDYSPKFFTLLISAIFMFRAIRGILLYSSSITGYWNEEIIHPILYARGIWLYVTAIICILGWQYFYTILGWNWEFP